MSGMLTEKKKKKKSCKIHSSASVQEETDVSGKHGGWKFHFGIKSKLKEKLHTGLSLNSI